MSAGVTRLVDGRRRVLALRFEQIEAAHASGESSSTGIEASLLIDELGFLKAIMETIVDEAELRVLEREFSRRWAMSAEPSR